MSAVFTEFLDHFKTVLKFADAKIGVLKTRFDGDLYEKNIDKIADSYIKRYNDSQLNCTVEQRLATNFYDSVYRLYHDIKIASMTKLLNETKLGSEMYVEIDSFYKFAVELLLQESYRLHFKINEHYALASETHEAGGKTVDQISTATHSDVVSNHKVQESQEIEPTQAPESAEASELGFQNTPVADDKTNEVVQDDDDVEMSKENGSDDDEQEIKVNSNGNRKDTKISENDTENVLKNLDVSGSETSVISKNNIIPLDNLSSLAKSLSEDYDKILTSFKCKNNFALIIPNANEETSSTPLSLFSSLINKSELDMNEYKIPEPFTSLTILPQTTNTPSTNLKFICNTNPLNNSSLTGNNKVPNATGVPPIEIMRPIFHPNWFSLPSIPWLDFKSSTTFIPLIDETLSVISVKNKNKIYYEQIGLKKLQQAALDIKNRLNDKENQKSDNISNVEKGDENLEEEVEQNEVQVAETEKEMPKLETTMVEDKISEEASEEHSTPEDKIDTLKPKEANENIDETQEITKLNTVEKPGILPINVQNILEWKNGNVFDDDELNAFEQGEEQQLLSKILIDMNKLRSQRHTSTSKVTKPCATERKLYYKSKRILEIIIHKLKPSDLVDNNIEEIDTISKFKDAVFEDNGIRLSHSIPVLATNYTGTLPIPFAANNSNVGKNKIGSSNRSHKKRK